MKTRIILTLFIFSIILIAPVTVFADGIIIPQPPICDPAPCPPDPIPISQLEIRYHYVDVIIDEQLAKTHIDQVFYNPNDWTVEGMYVFPIPRGASVTDFRLWIDDKPVQGRVLEADEARQAYEEIVRELKDPALLEYADQGALQASVFPIPPKGERRIELDYSEIIPSENGLIRYVYPLNTEKFSTQPLKEVRVKLDITSSSPIRAAYSSSHPVEIIKDNEYHMVVEYEEESVKPDTDFVFYYSIGDDEAFHLLSYLDPGDPSLSGGFFTLLLAPRPQVGMKPLPKDIILVLDRSGSMEGEKFLQAQDALRYILQHLNPDDRFNLIAFNTGIKSFANEMKPVSYVEEALSWVIKLYAAGSTDINRALLEAAAFVDQEKPTYLIFLTDGLPTEGVVKVLDILENFEMVANQNIRFHAFGVGYDVDTFLLDSLAERFHGSSTYVLPGEDIDEILSSFYARISSPVLTNLELDFGEIDTYDLYPSPLPDLFEGDQIVVVGRYLKGGITEVTLKGEINQVEKEYRFADQYFLSDPLSVSKLSQNLQFIPRLWATRKIGYLLNQIRLYGPEQEIIDQIVNISIRYGIVTPYTSYLVTEPMPLGSTVQERIVEEQLSEMEGAQNAPTYGREAVEKAHGQGELAQSDLAYSPLVDQDEILRFVGNKTFILLDGIWVDTTFDPEDMKTIKVSFLSDDYFDLARVRPNLAAAFALGMEVIVISDGIAYEVVGENEIVNKVNIPEPILVDLDVEILSDDKSTPEEVDLNYVITDREVNGDEEDESDVITPTSLVGTSTPVNLRTESTKTAENNKRIETSDSIFHELQIRTIVGVSMFVVFSSGLVWYWLKHKK